MMILVNIVSAIRKISSYYVNDQLSIESIERIQINIQVNNRK